MKYSIEPLNITGSNRFGRTIAATKGIPTKNTPNADLEETLRSKQNCDGFYLTTKLPINLKALVLRNLKPGKEIVRLIIAEKQIDLRRNTDIGVSCNPNGDEVLVDTLNIEFRDINDAFTDRGIVWVYPGSPATVGFMIKSEALRIPGMVTEIVTAAEEAVKTKILKYQ